MIRNWNLTPAPCDNNSERYKLEIDGKMTDIFMIVKELGKICSRPEKTSGTFNFSMYLSKVDSFVDEKLNKIADLNGINHLRAEKSSEAAAAKTTDTPDLDTSELKSDMGMQLFPSAFSSFGNDNSLPGVTPAAAASASLMPNPGMDAVFVHTPEESPFASDAVLPGTEDPGAMSSESQPMVPIPDYEKLEEERLREEAEKQVNAKEDAEEQKTDTPTNMAQPLPPSLIVTQRSRSHAVNPNISNRSKAKANTPMPAASSDSVPSTQPPSQTGHQQVEKPNAPKIKEPEKKRVNPFSAVQSKSGFIPASHIIRHKEDSAHKKQEKEKEKEEVVENKVEDKLTSISLNTRWNIELPLVPIYGIGDIIPGSHNRFAHAATMAVIENPGAIYNPLLIYGPASTGKTHFVNAVASELAKTLGYENIFVTTGLRLAKGVDLAIQDKKIEKLDKQFGLYKALIIDDIHLMSITETNKPYIAKWCSDFVAQNKQIIVTTSLPAHALSSLEDSLNFQFSQGWMVELKNTSQQNYKAILSQIQHMYEIEINENEINEFFVNRKMPFRDILLSFMAVKKLRKFIETDEHSYTDSELLEMIFGLKETAPEMPVEEDLEKAARWKPSTQDLWLKWGIFYPKGRERDAYYSMYSLFEHAKKLGVDIEWQQIFVKEYDPMNMSGSAFEMGDFALTQNVNGVVILGPQPATDAFEKETDFRHLVSKIIENLSIKYCWIPYEKMKSQSVNTRALIDLM